MSICNFRSLSSGWYGCRLLDVLGLVATQSPSRYQEKLEYCLSDMLSHLGIEIGFVDGFILCKFIVTLQVSSHVGMFTVGVDLNIMVVLSQP